MIKAMGKGMELMSWIISQLPELEKRDVIFFAFRGRKSNQTRVKEGESPSLPLKAERRSMELLGALELNAC